MRRVPGYVGEMGVCVHRVLFGVAVLVDAGATALLPGKIPCIFNILGLQFCLF